MNIKKVSVVSFRGVSLLGCIVITAILSGSNVLCQEKKVVKTEGTNVGISRYTEISEATEPCEPAVCEWWGKLRQSANDLLRKGDDKSKKKFVLLFADGLEKSYRVPLKDSPPKMLVTKPPFIEDLRRTRKIRGDVVVSVEVRSDSSMGDIIVTKGLSSDVNQRVIQAVRQTLFLPAIKDGTFVTMKAEDFKFSFWSQ